MQKIAPFLWFDGQAEKAARYYVSIFKKSKIRAISRYGEAGPGPVGSVMCVDFELEGQKFIALNAGPEFKFNLAISFMVDCKDQREVDYFWKKLSAGGKKLQCGWLTDKFGVPWQIVPRVLMEMLDDEDTEKSQRAMRAMMSMVKLDIKKLKKAYDG
jgi:predicted 3-demethylubiquinone-9 3-methyltransferase (glyoxalase superfamily)